MKKGSQLPYVLDTPPGPAQRGARARLWRPWSARRTLAGRTGRARDFYAVTIALAALLPLVASCAFAPPLSDVDGSPIDGGIAELESVVLGGETQWISIRGRFPDAPVLLSLHGGPGASDIPLTRRYFAGLIESSFVVVNWDQRGSGKSCGAAKKGTLTVDQLIADMLELVDYLRARFHKDKIYVLGHSWGALLGVVFVSKYPDRVAAYGGMGQLVYGRRNEAASYKWTLEQARAQNNERAVAELEKISWYPDDPMRKGWWKAIRIERKWLGEFGGVLYSGKGWDSVYLGETLFEPEYTFCDSINWIVGDVRTMKTLWPQAIEIDLSKQASKLEVPVYFFMGRSDWNTPGPLVEEYFDMLDAPRKELVWFERSGHCPNSEEPERFGQELVRTFLGAER